MKRTVSVSSTTHSHSNEFPPHSTFETISHEEAHSLLQPLHLPADLARTSSRLLRHSVIRLRDAVHSVHPNSRRVRVLLQIGFVRNKALVDHRLHVRILTDASAAATLPLVRELCKRSTMEPGEAQGEAEFVVCEMIGNSVFAAFSCHLAAPAVLFINHPVMARMTMTAAMTPFVSAGVAETLAGKAAACAKRVVLSSVIFALIASNVGQLSQASANALHRLRLKNRRKGSQQAQQRSVASATGLSSGASSTTDGNDGALAQNDEHNNNLPTADSAGVEYFLYALLSASSRYQALAALDLLVESSPWKSKALVVFPLVLRAASHFASFETYEALSLLLDSIVYHASSSA